MTSAYSSPVQYNAYATPPRPGPGGYVNTPAPQNIRNAPSFRDTPALRRYPQDVSSVPTAGSAIVSQPTQRPAENLTAAERTGRAINEALEQVKRTNSLEQEYQGRLAFNYELRTTPIWTPFQKVREHRIPDQIFEQMNRTDLSVNTGLFADLHYAWVTADNALYMWDYTQNNPELLGFEDQPYPVTMVRLARPKPGVFLDSIKHMIVLATTEQIMLLGLGTDPAAPNAGLTLFSTGMTASVRGLNVTEIVCSEKTGRVFFGSDTDNEVRELRYQAQDSWFASRCSVVNHTQGRLDSFTGALKSFTSGPTEYMTQLAIDDSRDSLYTLSSKSSIRAFHMGTNGSSLDKRAEINIQAIHRGVDSPLQNGPISNSTKLVSISALGREETQAWILLATTVEGYRIYLNGTYSYTQPPMLDSITVSHTRTPPLLPAPPQTAAELHALQQRSVYLTQVALARRFAPGYFVAAIARPGNPAQHHLFISAPDAQADSTYARPQQGPPESASWHELSFNQTVMDIGIQTPYKGATPRPAGFSYELGVQFDEAVPEVAVLTTTGIVILRRTRFVDSMASLIRQSGPSEGFQNEIQKLILKYGRQEVVADALAVACGQSLEPTQDRKIRINSPDVLESARKVFIEHGGRPSVDQNAAASSAAPIDAVRPSPRYEATTRYVSRLIRSTWKEAIARQERTLQGLQILSNVKVEKLRAVQENLVALQTFFKTNKSFIRGLSGPDDLNRQASKDDEIALQGEHRALTSLVKFISEMIEAISFVLVLFEEKVAEIVPLLPEQSRNNFLIMTYEQLVSTRIGMDVAKDLVKAIVNRNIAKGSNVETIAEALRRKCGNFCSADDVVIFKAQELLKRATESKANVEASRNYLNESLGLFEKVAVSLPQDYLEAAVKEYVELQFFGGAIQLALKVAQEKDKTNEAHSWMSDGRPDNDLRRDKYEQRTRCYDLIHNVLEAIETTIQNNTPFIDGRPSLAAVRRDEAYDVIGRSKDEVFLTNLFDWYLSKNWTDRLLSTDTVSDFTVTYLQRKSEEQQRYADLLWRFYGNNAQYHEAAKVQLSLAQSTFPLGLDQRLEYLSRARANASAFTTNNNTTNRKTKQKLLTEINSLIEVANIQDELLQRLKDDDRLTGDNRNSVLSELDGPIQSISDLFNKFADSAGYYDVCLYIYAIADHRDASQIKNTWAQFLQSTHERGVAEPPEIAPREKATPLEVVIEEFRTAGKRLRSSEAVFPVSTLIEMLERYNTENGQDDIQTQHQRNEGSQANDEKIDLSHWVADVFIELEVQYETLYDGFETLYLTMTNQPGISAAKRRVILSDLLYVIERWLHVSYARATHTLFGGEAGQERVGELLAFLTDDRNRQIIGQQEYTWALALRDRVLDLVA